MRRDPLTGWLWLVGVLAALNYAARAASGKPNRDVLYTWGAAANGGVLLGIVLAVVLVLARGRLRELLALRRPRSWPAALGIALGVFVAVSVLGRILDPLLHAGREQGLTPTHWEPSRAAPFAANAFVVTLLAPVTEELTYRGLGFSVLRRFGVGTAIAGVGLAFGLGHGLIEALPLLVAFGAGLAYLRYKTESVYPGMLLHAFFNGVALAVSITT